MTEFNFLAELSYYILKLKFICLFIHSFAEQKHGNEKH